MRNLTRRDILIGGSAAAAALSIEGCSGGGAFLSQPGIPSDLNSYTLTTEYATNTFGGMTVHTRTYNGQIPGPTLFASPGQPFSVQIVNNLPPDPAATAPPGIDPLNNPHLFNTTNLHVHGVQVVPHLFDPVGTSDPASMMIHIASGEKFTYNFVLPDDHPSGLYWYHPHHHGSTDTEVAGGMAGLIVVGGPIDQVPEIAAARDIHVAVQSLSVNADSGTPNLFDLEYTAYNKPNAGGYTPRAKYELMLTNGQLVNVMTFNGGQGNPGTFTSQAFPPPSISMQPGEVVRLRVLNGLNELNLPLVLPGFEVYVIGHDGVNLLAPQLLDQSDPATNVFATVAHRVEMLVRAPQTPGTYTLSGLSFTDSNQVWPKFDLLHINVAGSPVTMGIPATLPTPTREYPLIADGEIVRTRTANFNSVSSTTMQPGTLMLINNQPYSETTIPPDFGDLRVGTAEAWTVTNSMPGGHPFHLHTNSFELHSSTDINGVTTTYDPPQICDTAWVPGMGQITIRVRFKTWKGKDVFHCHKLSHEDQGMMINTLLI